MGFFDKYPYTDFHELNLDWVLNHFKDFITEIDSLNEWKAQHETEYQELKECHCIRQFSSGNVHSSSQLVCAE